MSFPAAARGFVVFFLSVQVVQGQHGWGVTCSSTEICAVKGSTVEISCRYTYPFRWRGGVNTVEKTFWFAKQKDGEPVDLRTDSEYAGRVETLCENNICTLRIRNLRESDSAQYRFSIKTNQAAYIESPRVTLSVTDLQVKVSRAYLAQAELRCQTRCPGPDHTSYVWYNNGEKLWTGMSSSHFVNFSSADSYSCALNGNENHRSPSVYAPKLPSVSVSPSAEIEEGSSVTLTCSTNANPAANYTWYKDETSYSLPLKEEPQLVLSSIHSSDSGVYFCTAKNKLGRRTSKKLFIDVKHKSPLIMNISRLTLVALILTPLLLLCLWMRKKKKAVRSISELHEPIQMVELDPCSVYENISDLNMVSAARTEEPEELV
ncbi:myelin-associated glycoprotein-like isoform X2 [Eleginops maclovinus]|uniref:myelin-associated glycoprotein-like isoform X2 n=1 Tax=Eleginops maclovinus TaxID=56733 RepID=UPI0030800D1C